MVTPASPTTAPYGSWKSPITTALITGSVVRFSQVDVDSSYVYWVEARPSEGGRNVLVRYDLSSQQIVDLTPAPINVRSTVQEYGGGAMLVHPTVGVIFSQYSDQQLYTIAPGSTEIQQLTHETEKIRFADVAVDLEHNQLICVVEDHTESDLKCKNVLAAVDLSTGKYSVLYDKSDFVLAPAVSKDGKQLAWLAFDFPNMPWDDVKLFTASLDKGKLTSEPKLLSTGGKESLSQPTFGSDNTLYCINDQTNWWNLYKYSEDGNSKPENLTPLDAEFSVPGWMLGYRTYQHHSNGTIVTTYYDKEGAHLAILDPKTKKLEDITPKEYRNIHQPHLHGDTLVFMGSSPTQLEGVVVMDLKTRKTTLVKPASTAKVDPAYVSVAQPITYPTTDNMVSHALYYPPKNPDYTPEKGALPPILVQVHGGPTGATSATLNYPRQYWTSRGWAIVDVNYRGSAMYGRKYRDALQGTWGEYDLDDAINAVKYLADKGLVDIKRTAITGGSAGGFTVMACLTFRSFFQAGGAHFGVADLIAMVKDTHKFESRYLDGLVGPYPQAEEVYKARSAVYHPDKMVTPMILFQGDEDKVVPPEQSRSLYRALKQKGVPTAYLEFAGEQHGFRQAKNIKRSIEAEYYFYGQIFGYAPADEIEPVEIDNWKKQ